MRLLLMAFVQLGKRYRHAIFLLIAMSAMISMLTLWTWQQNQSMRWQIQILQRDIGNLQKRCEWHQKRVHALRNSPSYVEFMLRHKLGYGYKGDQIIKIHQQE